MVFYSWPQQGDAAVAETQDAFPFHTLEFLLDLGAGRVDGLGDLLLGQVQGDMPEAVGLPVELRQPLQALVDPGSQ
jgi:hypothetical protein